VVDALSRRHTLFAKLGAQILGFNNILELYSQDHDFSTLYEECLHKPQGGYYVNEGYLFKEGCICIPQSSHKNLLIQEMHEWGTHGAFWGR